MNLLPGMFEKQGYSGCDGGGKDQRDVGKEPEDFYRYKQGSDQKEYRDEGSTQFDLFRFFSHLCGLLTSMFFGLFN
jgi:hypothetical protein